MDRVAPEDLPLDPAGKCGRQNIQAANFAGRKSMVGGDAPR
jgi:hypothetical protein